MISEFAEAPLAFFLKYGMTALYGIAVWCLLAPLLILALHTSIRPLIERLSRSIAKT